MNRPTLTLKPGVTPRPKAETKLNTKSDDSLAWQEYKQEHHAAKKQSKRKTTTLFLRRRIREQNRDKKRNFSSHIREDASVPVEEKQPKTDQKKFLHKNKLVGKLSSDSLDALMALKNNLAKAPVNAK